MKNKPSKINISIRNNPVTIDKYFLDLLSVARFDAKYEDQDIRKQVNAIVRDLVSNEPKINPMIVHQKIALSLLPKSKQAIMLSTDIQTKG
jgi:hypothetical protein